MDLAHITHLSRLWNALIAPKMRVVGYTDTHILLVHPTKGKRRVSRKRLGLT